MRIYQTILMLLVTVQIGYGKILEPFSSIYNLAERADWVGILRVESVFPPKNSLSEADEFMCAPLIQMKGDLSDVPPVGIKCRMVDTSTWHDRNGKNLAVTSVDDQFQVGNCYLAFMLKNQQGLRYVPVNGAILKLPPNISLRYIRDLTIEDAFLVILEKQEEFFSRQAKYARLQRQALTSDVKKDK